MPEFWKNKKILVYIALAHHTRFISPVMEKLSRYGAKVDYVIGQAERSQEITAINLGLNYTHVFDWLKPEDQTDIQDNYLRLRNTFSTNLKNGYLYSSTPVTVTDKTIHSTAMEYVGFRNIMIEKKPDIGFALHELNRWGKMFSFWAKKFNVPVVTFQEGLYYGMDFGYTGHLQYSTFNLVWGKRIKHKLIDFEAPADRVIEVGNTHLANEIERQKKNSIRKKKRQEFKCKNKFAVLLLFSGEIPDINELHPLFKAVSASTDKKLFIKFHPSARHDQVERWISMIPKAYKPAITTFSGDENLYDLLSMSDVVALTQTSTTGLEALFFKKPLVILDVKTSQRLAYSFTEFKVAVQMTPKEFGKAVSENTDFTGLTDQKDIDKYLETELSGTRTAIETVIDISEKIIKAKQTRAKQALKSTTNETRDWSIIVELPKTPENILRQLEAIALNSEGSGTFEVILIEPCGISKQASEILDTLKGDLIRLKTVRGQSIPEMMNKAALSASGRTLVFIKEGLVPMPGWLGHLDSGIKKYGKNKIWGARILDDRGGICHDGIIINKNNSPVSPYNHLPAEYPNALKERSFQMIDHFTAMNRSHFYRMGGFWEKAGSYSFMDICLRAGKSDKKKDYCIYLPKVCLAKLKNNKKTTPDEAIYFYGRWQGRLWENQEVFYKTDQITESEINTARLAQSMATL